MSGARLRTNVAAGMAATAAAGVASIVSAPLIYRGLGAGAYGLVGFYLVLQSLLPLFDAGMTAGVARATAWYHGRGSLGRVRRLLRIARRPILLCATVLLIGFLAALSWIAARWVGQGRLGSNEIHSSLVLMGIALALRLPMLLDRAALVSLEHQVFANSVQAAASVARTLGAYLVAVLTHGGLIAFFVVQVVVSLAEIVSYRVALRGSLVEPEAAIERDELVQHVRFSLGVAALSSLWLASSQVDRLVLSRSLPLDRYGTYSLGVHLASAITLVVAALAGAIQPRLTRLLAAGKNEEARRLYGLSTGISLALAFSALVAVMDGGALLLPSVRRGASPDPIAIATLYGVGNIATVVMAQAYQLQNALGVLRLHAWITAGQAAIQVPTLAFVASSGNAMSTAWAFALISVVAAAICVPVVHRRFLASPGDWWWRDCAPPLAVGVVCASVAGYVKGVVAPNSLIAAVIVAATAGATLVAVAAAHGGARRELHGWLRHGRA